MFTHSSPDVEYQLTFTAVFEYSYIAGRRRLVPRSVSTLVMRLVYPLALPLLSPLYLVSTRYLHTYSCIQLYS